MGKLLLLVLAIGLVIYLVVRLIETRGALFRGGGSDNPPSSRPDRPRGPLGPDDDPEFLRDLNRRKPKPGQDPPT